MATGKIERVHKHPNYYGPFWRDDSPHLLLLCVGLSLLSSAWVCVYSVCHDNITVETNQWGHALNQSNVWLAQIARGNTRYLSEVSHLLPLYQVSRTHSQPLSVYLAAKHEHQHTINYQLIKPITLTHLHQLPCGNSGNEHKQLTNWWSLYVCTWK